MPDRPVPEPEVIAEHKFSTEAGDVLECGIIEINEDRQPVAYASLGETSVCISRNKDGKVVVEIDDVAEEPVYVFANLQVLRATGELHGVPWHEEVNSGE